MEAKYYKVDWIFNKEQHFCYVKAATTEDAMIRMEKMLNRKVRITGVVEIETHQIASPYDICIDFRNPRLDDNKLCG